MLENEAAISLFSLVLLEAEGKTHTSPYSLTHLLPPSVQSTSCSSSEATSIVHVRNSHLKKNTNKNVQHTLDIYIYI